jgi:hypothetical protein
MFSNMWFPVFSLGVRMMRQIGRPTSLDDIPRALAVHNNLIGEFTRLGHDEHV